MPNLVSTKLSFRTFLCSLFFLITSLSLILLLSNDTELNPGPKKDISNQNFSIAYWNLKSIAAQNFIKLSQLETYITMHSYDLIPFSKTWLDLAISTDSNDLSLKGYKLHRVGNLDNVKKAGACVYYKETLVVHCLQTKLHQCNVTEINFKNKKKIHVTSLYRSPSQTPHQFDNFL